MINVVLNFFAAANPCTGGSFLGFPTWYTYLDGKTITDSVTKVQSCTPVINGLSDIWLIVAAVLEILLRLAAIAAVAFVVIGGVEYIMSQGEPDRTHKAQGTIINALIGLVIAIGAATVVSYIAGKFNG